jgi:hypothetical protein
MERERREREWRERDRLEGATGVRERRERADNVLDPRV